MQELPKRAIIKKNSDFQQFYNMGKSYADKYLVIYVLYRAEFKGEVCFAAGKSLGTAVVRNRVKRLLRECYRLHRQRLRNDCSLLLIGRKPVMCRKLATVEKSFFYLAQKAGILR